MAACWAAFLGGSFTGSGEEKKESWAEAAALIFVRKGWFVGTTNIRVTPTF